MPKEKTLKIAFVYDDSLDGSEGVTQQVKILGSWMSERGHKVSYFVGQSKIRSWEGGRVYSLSRNIRVVFNGNYVSIPLPANKRGIKNALKAQQPDVLHVQMPHSPYMAQRVVDEAYESAAVVGTYHVYPASPLVSWGAKVLRLLYLRGLRKFDAVSAVSTAAQDFADSAFNMEAGVIPNTIEVAKLRSDTKNKPATVVFLGRLVERKGCRQLIEAFRIVHGILPDARLVIGGKGPQAPALKKLVAQYGLDVSVEFKGFIDEDKKGDFMASGTVACFPSLYGESFGLVLVEAMAAGTGVVIGGDNPGYRSVLGEKPELLFDPKNKEVLAAKIVELLKDTSQREDLHEWQQNVVGQYDVDTVGPQIERLYAAAIAKMHGRRHN
jgi:phosphatidylinositol alpha-mannosyltransferase